MEAEAKAKVPVTARALVQRINRKLRGVDQLLRKTRYDHEAGVNGSESRAWQDLGDYYVVDLAGPIVEDHVDLEALGRKLGVLEPWEAIHTPGEGTRHD